MNLFTQRLNSIRPLQNGVFICLIIVLQPHDALAASRTSASYSIVTENASAGGGRATSANYTSDGSAGGVVGVSTAASPSQTVKNGYIGQLYEVSAVQIAAAPITVNEGATRQLAATATLDDATTAALLGTEVSWNVASGPIAGISSSGLAAAGNVHQDTAAMVQGSYAGVEGTSGLTVLNVGNDDLGIYATDGIPDTWQVQFFGENNPLATATADATGTGQNNLFKYIAGLNPTDPASRFVTSVAGGTGAHTITLSPRLTDRSYTVEFSTTLSPNGWQPLTGAAVQDNGQTRTVTDPDGTSLRKFYRVQVSYP